MGPSLWLDFSKAFHRWTGIALSDSGASAGLMLLAELADAEDMALEDFVDALDALGQRENRQRLIDAFVVNTTWFSRETGGLESLIDALVTDSQSGVRPHRLRLWSCGCSTGQEPYQIAMMLMKREVDFEIVATDISDTALKNARRGVFRRESVGSGRRLPQYFKPLADGRVEVSPELRESVTFRRHNLARMPHVLSGEAPFDAVICRNLLIYFDRAMAVRVIDRFGVTLSDRNGFLLLGAAEQPLVWLSDRLQPVPEFGGALLRPRLDGAPIEVQRLPRQDTPQRQRPSGRVRRASRPIVGGQPRSSAAVSSPSVGRNGLSGPIGAVVGSASEPEGDGELKGDRPPSAAMFDLAAATTAPVAQWLAEARRCYSSKDMSGALDRADRAIAANGLCIDAFLLRGMILKEQGRSEEAIASFRSARFLESKDAWMAVYQLGLLLEVSGDHAGAREAYRHTLWSLEQGGRSGWSGDDIDEDVFASITRDACNARLAGLERRSGR